MPTVTTTLYLSDEDYNEKYLPKKQEVLNKMRIFIRNYLGIKKKGEKKWR